MLKVRKGDKRPTLAQGRPVWGRAQPEFYCQPVVWAKPSERPAIVKGAKPHWSIKAK